MSFKGTITEITKMTNRGQREDKTERRGKVGSSDFRREKEQKPLEEK